MLGDWAHTPDGDFKITGIEDNYLWVGGNYYAAKDVTPIPLTSDILKKNGFGYTEGDEYLTHYYLGEECYCANMDLHIGSNNKGGFWLNTYGDEIHGIKYVHELQHALRICGIDKEIEYLH